MTRDQTSVSSASWTGRQTLSPAHLGSSNIHELSFKLTLAGIKYFQKLRNFSRDNVTIGNDDHYFHIIVVPPSSIGVQNSLRA